MFISNVKEIYIIIESGQEGYRIFGVNTSRDNALAICNCFESDKKKYNFITLNLVDLIQAAFDPDYCYSIEFRRGDV